MRDCVCVSWVFVFVCVGLRRFVCFVCVSVGVLVWVCLCVYICVRLCGCVWFVWVCVFLCVGLRLYVFECVRVTHVNSIEESAAILIGT